MYFIDGKSESTQILNSGMYNMQLEVRSKAPITVTFDNQQKEYGDPNPAMTATATGLIGSDTVTSVTGSYSCDATSPVGSYTGSATGYTLTNGNQAYYPNVTFVNTSPTLTVNQRNISITSQSLSKLYGAADPTHTYTVTSGSVVNGDTIGQITRASGETVDTYAYSLTSPNSNYNITFTSTNFTINKRPVTITPDALSKVQGNSDPTLTYATNLGSWAPLTGAWADFAGELSRDPGETQGTYNILQNTLTNINNSNYDITFTSGVKFTITAPKATRTITYTGPSSLQYNGSLQAFTGATLSHSDDNDTISYSGNTFTDVPASGKLNFTISAPESTNYQACSLDVEVSVTKIALTIAINNATSVYRATLDTLTSSLTTGTLAGGQDAGKTYNVVLNLNLTTTATTTSNVNTYPISGNYTNGNYDVTFTGSYTGGTQGTYTITKATPVITTTGVNKTYKYNGLEQEVNSGATTDQVGDYISPIAYSNNKFTNVGTGTQVVTISTAENQNYNAATTTVTITISKIALTVSIADKTSVYKESIVELTSTLTTGTLAGGQDAGKTYNVVLNLTLSTTATSSSNANTYPITGSYTNGNYDVTFTGSYSGNTQGTYTIAKADSVVSGTLGPYTYTGSQQTINGLTLNHTETTIQYSNNTFTNVPAGGIQQVTYHVAPTTNYNGIGNTTVDVTINKADSVISGSLGTYTYNGSEQTITGLTLSKGDGTIVYINNKFTDVPTTGTQKVKYSVAATNNYNGIAETEVDVTISKLAITVTIEDKSSVYGSGSLSTLTSTVPAGALVGQDASGSHITVLGISLSTDAKTNSNAGTYAISGLYDSGNYAVTFYGSYSGNTQGTYTIDKADSVISGNLGTYTFSGAEQTITGLTLSTGDGTIVYTNNKFTDVPTTGTQKVKYSVAPTTNYNGIAETEVEVTINKASTVIVTTGVNKTYTYNGLEQEVNSGATTEQVGTAGVAVAAIKYSNNTFINVGTGKHTVTIYTDATQNYLAGNTTVEITISAREITVTIGDKGSAYGADIVTLTSSVTSGSLAGGQDADKTHVEVLNLTLSTTATKTSNVGTYPISGSYDNGNYAVTFSGSYTENTTKGTYTIGKASVTATISDASKTYGQNDPTFDFVVNSGLVNGDEKAALGITLERINTSNAVGEYTITKASQTNNNYEVTMTSGKLTINAKAIEIKVEDKTSIYGSSVADLSWVLNTGSSMAYEEVASAVLVINLSCAASSSSNVGEYAISGAVDATSSKNYSISFVGTYASDNTKGTYEITPATVDVTISNASKTYGQDDPSFGFTVTSGLVNPDTASSLGLTLVRANSTVQTVGTYAITKDSHTNNNYLVNVTQDGVFTINAKAIEVKVEDKTSVYGQAVVDLSWVLNTGSSMAYSEDASTVLVINLACGVTTSSPRGTYPITGTVDENSSDNYSISFVGSYASDNTKGTYEITQRGVTVKANSDSRIYWSMKQEDETYSATITYAGDFDPATAGEGIVAVNVVLERENGEDVNTYSILASADMAANNPNYDITFTAGTYEITKFNISITPTTGQSKTYGDADPATYTYEDLIYPEGTGYATLVGALGRAAGEDVNTYAYNIDSFKAVDNPNYNITLVEGKTFAINRKSVTITPTALSKQYGNLDPELTFGNNLGEWKASSDSWAAITGVLSRIPGETVNTYAITQGEVTNANNGNYDITFVDSVVFTITRRDVTITPDDNQGKEYYSCLQADEGALTYTHTSLKDVSFVDFTPDVLDGKLARVEGEDAGNYLINLGTLINYNNPNYNLNIDAVNYVISKFKVQVTADSGKEKVYGEVDPVFTYTTDSMPAVEGYKALEGALTRKNLTIQTVGDYQILQGTLTNTKNSNYDITFVSASFQITKKAVTITPDTLSKQYGNLDPELTFGNNLGEWKADETGSWAAFVGQLSRNDGEIVGEYGILPGTLVEYNNPNYDINFIDTVKFTITRRDITVTPNSNQSKEYYECLQVAESDLTYTHSALKDANFESFTPKALEGTLARAEGEDAGDYLINLGTLTNDKNSNYNISIETEYYVIRPFEVEITPNSGQEKVYGEVDPVFAYTTDRMPAIEGYKALEGKLTRANIDEQNAGNYQILQGNLTNAKNSNYNITFSVSVVTFKINPKFIEIKIADKSSLEGDEPVQLTWTLNDGFSMAYEENAETELIITLVAIDVTSSSAVGEYEIIGTVEASSSNNYLITFVGNHIDGDKGIYTIIAAMLLNPVFNLSYFNTHIYTYTGETQTVGSGAILEIGTANQKANIKYSNNTFTTVSEGNALLVKVSVEADGEYNAYSTTFRIKVQKAETQINLSSMKTVFTYNGQLQTASGAKVNHLENANITYENNTFTTVSEGNGKVVKIKAAATANYKAKEATVTLTVNKATYDFSHCTFENQEKEYNCEEQMIEIEGKLPVGFDGSKPKVEYIGSLKNVGCVEVKVKITSTSENYMIPEIDAERCAMLTICKKRITISVKPFLAIENKKYNFEFDIDGLQGTDTMEIFDVKPEVEGYGTSIEVEAGRYTVKPFGASATNYEISYLPYTLIVHKENLTSDLGNNVDLTITGYYDPSFQLEVTPDKDFEFDDPLSKILHIVQKSYKVRVVGGEGLELPESIKLIYRDNTLKSSILNRAYWINENGEKINLSAKDVVKEGFIETKFTGESGELIIYKDYTVIYIIASVSILVFLVVLYLIYREYRDKKKRAAQKAEATEEARKANIRKNVKSKEDKQPKVKEDKNKTVELKDQKDLPKTEESKDSNEKKE
ncbi:MAG: hypothetical protein GX906_05595 [Clostridiales bacterium]|jgi:hypothetical protein|nr:hypothetical protein [Clostridiales bacterium]